MRLAVAMILAGAAMLPSTTASAQANDRRNSFVERRLRTLATVPPRGTSRFHSGTVVSSGRCGHDGRVVTLAAADRIATLVLPQIGKAVTLTDEMLAPLVEFGGQVQAIPLDRPRTIDASVGSHTGGSLPSRRSVDRPSLILARPCV
jgi:hypothetical protein